MNVSQNADFSTNFQTLNKDFSEMRKFQLKPLKPRCDICLKTPNPEGFCVTPKTRQVRDDSSQVARGGSPPWLLIPAPVQNPLKSKVRTYVFPNHGFEAKFPEKHCVSNIALSHHKAFPVCSHGPPGHGKVLSQHI